MFSSCRNTEKSSTQILKALSFLILSLSIVSKNSQSQFGLDQSERNHVIWRLFLTFRCIHTHPHLNLSSLPLSFQISIIFSLPFFFSIPAISFFQMSFHFVCFFVDYMQCEWFCQRSILLSTYFILPCREDQELLQLLCSDQSSLAVEVISCPC